ncbi:hypothetical protein DIPPA_54937 [Diplonema papillatum]|nr:hypothetical protein DIPPA_54937 [Diplonema papillatum]
MVWSEGTFQVTKGREVAKNHRAPAALLLENGATKKWHTLLNSGCSLPAYTKRQLGTGVNQSVTPLRLFVGNSTRPEDRNTLETIGFFGVAGFDVENTTTLTLVVHVDVDGVMSMSAVDDQTGQNLLLGPGHKTSIVRKLFVPSYKTAK